MPTTKPAAEKGLDLSEEPDTWHDPDTWDFLREKAHRDALSLQADARKEGEKNAQLVIARKALGKNMPIEDIMDLTGLSAAEIQSLRAH
ncbi:MAG: hypothetical protein LBB55_05555 [Zoogloeaceae bacterium]|nr:hypothetical protein [Zoogloeaceae bacterium]